MTEELSKPEVFSAARGVIKAPEHFKKDSQWAQEYWRSKAVNSGDQDTLHEIMEAVAEWERRGGGIYPKGLAGFLKGGYRDLLDEELPLPPSATVQTPSVLIRDKTGLDEIDSAFQDRWCSWPRNSERPESDSAARSAYRARARRNGISDTETVCNHYLAWFRNPANGRVHPKHLSNLLSSDEEFDQHLEATKLAPTERDRDDFWLAWANHPEFEGQPAAEADSLEFYRLHVTREDRLDFLFYTRAYAAERREALAKDPGAGRWGRTFVKTVARWRAGKPSSRTLELVTRETCAVCRPILAVAKQAGLFTYALGQTVESRVTYMVRNAEATARTAVERVLKDAATTAGIDIDLDALVSQVLETTYVSACRKAGLVVS